MNKSLLIGKTIYNLLSNNDEIHTAVNNRIYPLIADNNAKFPFIVYKRNSAQSNGCKDGYWADNVSFEIVVVSDKYIDGLNLANNVRKILNREKITYDDITLNDVQLTSATENFIDNSFVQEMTFDAQVYN